MHSIKTTSVCCSGTACLLHTAEASQHNSEWSPLLLHIKTCQTEPMPYKRNLAGFLYLFLRQNRKLLTRADYNKENCDCLGPLLCAWVTVSYVMFLNDNPGPCASEDSAATDTQKSQLSNKWLQKNTTPTKQTPLLGCQSIKTYRRKICFDTATVN